MMPLLIGGMESRQATSRAEEVLSLVGSPGVCRIAQRVVGGSSNAAPSRAPCTRPSVVLADEPSGTWTCQRGSPARRFFRLAREYETAVVVVTHNRSSPPADRILLLEDGRLATVSSVDAIP